ncbi:hypothetical protein [Aureimonas mangrovi]|uniref:hypothetical protein n=1 Tax=Aureimonas mangrovi TaxID=2758041 RepID=UPI00163D5C8F|nr:hypothetical protein [Aureimonas mangrovi]
MARLDPISREIDLMVADLATPEARSARLAEFAGDEIARVKIENKAATGRDAPHEVYVDGVRGAPLAVVKPDGVVIAEFDLMDEVLEWIGEQLLLTSPILTGAYMRSHILFADDVEVTPGNIPQGAREYVFLNSQPYARKIEGGDSGRQPQSAQAPDGVYEAISTTAAKRFGNIARIGYGFRSLTGAKAKSDRQPAIFVRAY